MNSAILLFCGLMVAVNAQGPTTAIAGASCESEGWKAVDASNMCWYHECTINDNGDLAFLPRRCAWMSKVSYNFVQGDYNPCTVNLMDGAVVGNPCDRNGIPSVDGPPPCATTTNCFNGGTARFEADKCWCDCPVTWWGNHDCSIPTQEITNLPPGSNICVDGVPQDDYCTINGGCLNGGTCFNQCDTFWCDCGEEAAEIADHIDKRCEIFQSGK